MSKLLNKPLKAFILYALLILAGSVPVYYYVVDAIWIDELDDHNEIVKAQVQAGFNNVKEDQAALEKSIALFRRIQPGIIITPADGPVPDSVFTTEHLIMDGDDMDMERFRVLRSAILINGHSYRIIVETNIEEADETALAIALITCVFIALLIFGFILLNKRLSRRLWQPFTDTLTRLKQFDLSNSSRIDFMASGIIEFEELHQALNKLIAANVRAYAQQKEFVQNASHELQTPLALLKSKIDLLIQDPALTETQRVIIEALADSVSRVSRINRNLLLLAGLENKAYASEKITVNDRLDFVLNSFRELNSNRLVEQELKEKVTVMANEALTDIVITNLVSNAYRHSAPDAAIAVFLNAGTLVIANPGKDALNHMALFKRFQSASPDNPGTGLGLAIASEICNRYGWTISYRFEKGEHRFSVRF